MQTYRLVIGPDGRVKIPNGEPGRTVKVLVEESSPPVPSEPLKPIAAKTREEREQLKEEFLERGRRIRARSKGRLPIRRESELYGKRLPDESGSFALALRPMTP